MMAENLGTSNPRPEVLSPAALFTPQLQVIAALLLAVVILTSSILYARKKSTRGGDAIILVGCSDAGKTAILSTLVYRQTLSTHTSMQTNVALVALPASQKTFRLVDVPGHPRIRGQFEDHLPHAKAIAFVVDASTISRNGLAVAEHLHMILSALTSLPPSRETPSLTILAHKCDLIKSTANATAEQLAINRIKTILERELEKRRASHANGVGVESLGADGADSQMGGLECTGSGEFRFADWEGGDIGFIGTWVTVGKEAAPPADEKPLVDGLSPLREWMEAL